MVEKRHGYGRGCRCDACQLEWATYMRRYRHAHGVRPRDRYYQGQRGRRGFTVLTEQVLDAAAARTGRHWREVAEQCVREFGARVEF